MPVCKLCLKEVNKLVDSHIIPKSFYLCDQNGVNSRILSNREYPKKSPQGLYDQFICEGCENKFGPWDDYAAKLLKQTKPSSLITAPNSTKVMAYAYENIDYEKLKLFFISLLWRVYSARNSFFERVILKQRVVEKLADSINTGNATPPEDLAVVLGKSDLPIANVVPEPFLEKIGGSEFCRIYLPGYVVRIKLDEEPLPEKFALCLLYPGTCLLAYHHDYDANGEAATACVMVQKNLESLKRKSK